MMASITTSALGSKTYWALGPAVFAWLTTSPSFAAAHIPASAVPQRRITADSRAMAFARRSSTVARRGAFPTHGRAPVQNASLHGNRGSAWHNHYDSYGRSLSPAARTPGYPQPSRAVPSYRSAAPARRAAPSFHYSARPAGP